MAKGMPFFLAISSAEKPCLNCLKNWRKLEVLLSVEGSRLDDFDIIGIGHKLGMEPESLELLVGFKQLLRRH